MKKLNLAIIGQGRSGRNIHGNFFKSDKNDIIKVVAVVDADAERRERALKEYPGCDVYESYTELFGRKDIDLVTNASYSEYHYPITLDLLRHGFNVAVEKPMAKDTYECDMLIKTAKENGVMLAVFQQTLLCPWHKFAKETMASGKLGEIVQISIAFNGLGRRWDWQTLQSKLAGSVYNTGPHPIGCALDYLDFDDNAKVVYSKLVSSPLTSGDAEDYAKIIITAPGKPVVDVEISALDAYSSYTAKFQGTKGTLKIQGTKYDMKYIVDGENPGRPVIPTFLKNEEGLPVYCSEQLITHEESGTFDGTAFDVGTSNFYHMVYNNITEGTPLEIKNENVKKIVGVMAQVHAENPLQLEYIL